MGCRETGEWVPGSAHENQLRESALAGGVSSWVAEVPRVLLKVTPDGRKELQEMTEPRSKQEGNHKLQVQRV